MPKKKSGKSVVFCQTPLGPLGLYSVKKIDPNFFLLENASIMAETNFTLPFQNQMNFLYNTCLIFPMIWDHRAIFKAQILILCVTCVELITFVCNHEGISTHLTIKLHH